MLNEFDFIGDYNVFVGSITKNYRLAELSHNVGSFTYTRCSLGNKMRSIYISDSSNIASLLWRNNLCVDTGVTNNCSFNICMSKIRSRIVVYLCIADFSNNCFLGNYRGTNICTKIFCSKSLRSIGRRIGVRAYILSVDIEFSFACCLVYNCVKLNRSCTK